MDDLQDQENSEQYKQADELARAQAELIKDYQRTFEQGPGKNVLQDLYRRFGFLQTTAGTDPYVTYFNEGQRAVVLFLIEQMKIDSNQLLEQLQAFKRGRNR